MINLSDQDYRSSDNEEDEKQKLFVFVYVPSFKFLRTINVFTAVPSKIYLEEGHGRGYNY